MKIQFSDIGQYVVPFPVFLQGTASAGQGEPLAYYIRFMESGQTPIGQASALTADSWVLGFDPIPARTATNNFNLWYIGTAGTISSTSTGTTPDLPPDFHDLIPRRICIYMAIADQSPTLDFYKSVYNDSLLKKLNRVVRGPQIGDERITVDWEDL